MESSTKTLTGGVEMKLIDIRETIPKHKTRQWSKQKNVKRIGVHTTASNNQNPNATASYHSTPSKDNHISTKGAPGLCYHDFITKDGTVYHCNNYDDVVWHWGLWNNNSVGVCLAYKGQDGLSPPDEMMLALEKHLVVLCLYLKVLPSNVYGHREVPGMFTILGNGSKKYKKTCPGMGIDLDKLRSSLTKNLQRRLAAEGLYNGAIDGLFWENSQRALNAFVPEKAIAQNLDWFTAEDEELGEME